MIESFLNSWNSWFPRTVGRFLGKPSLIHRELGYRRDDRLLVINIDDAGLCQSHNDAIASAFERGAATSCTVMTMTPGFEAFAALARDNPAWNVGVHLVLNAEWPRLKWGPVLDNELVPSLVGEDGMFYSTLWHAITRCDEEDVRLEWKAQIERALDFGIEVDHLDCHVGPYHFRPGFFEIARTLAKDYRIGLRVVAPWRKRGCHREGVPCGDWPIIISPRRGKKRRWSNLEQRRRQLLDRFQSLQPGISFWWTHISLDTEEWRAIRPPDQDLEQEDYPGEHRDQYEERIIDFQLLSDPSFKNDLETMGINLIGYRPLRDLFRKKR